ncbi:hypothetical protein [Algibacter sp. PT7-4]|uniref:hypothetical protein n=1 Tax=Algibacter ulvanivorans TaxID=3400999 RepID=UPI003AAD98C3
MKKTQQTDQEKITTGMMHYVEGKKYKQSLSRGFLAGAKFYKEEVLNNTTANQ